MALATDSRRSLSEQFREMRDEAMSMRGDVSGIATEVQRLLQMEMELAQAEIQEAKGHATKGTMFGAFAGVFALIMSVFLFLAIMFGLDTLMPTWAAALATTGIAAGVALLCGLIAMQQWRSFSPVPRRTMRTMQEDIKWARSQIKSNGR